MSTVQSPPEIPLPLPPIVARAMELFEAAWPLNRRLSKEFELIAQTAREAFARAVAESELVEAVRLTVEALQLRDQPDGARSLLLVGPRLQLAFGPFQKVPPFSDWPEPVKSKHRRRTD